ncbi:MAG: TatD family hydrolase [Chthoniobacterales bacterium]|nr:TatD family hydrolase [Chthoniobacterales bacterium]
MKLIETHAHLDDPRFTHDLDAVIARAHAAGVTHIITIGTNMESNRSALHLAERYPSIYAALGIHPTNVSGERTCWKRELRSLATHPKVVALGEIGLDYYHPPSDVSPLGLEKWKENQKDFFQEQLALALELGLNVIIHQRDLSVTQKKELSLDSPLHHYNAWEETLKILNSFTGTLRAVFHCFGGSPKQASEVVALGHLISFTGIITFKNAPLIRETARLVNQDHIMVETDAPYLAPIPYRGGRAEPAHVRLVAEKIAEVRGISLEEVAAVTTATAEHFFRF